MMASGTWLKRGIVAIFAAIAALFVTRKRAAAPGSKSGAEFKLPPVPDARASGPEDATPLTEDEQAMMDARAPEFKGHSAPAPEAVDAPAAPGPEEATPLTEDERAAFDQRLGASGEDAATPPPISFEIAKQNADEAAKLREAGDTEAADALDQRMYFAGSAATEADAPPPISYEAAKQNADEAARLREAGDTEVADALDQRMYVAGSGSVATEAHTPGDTTPEPTSEAFDVMTDGADHTGQEPAEAEDPTEVGLDIDVDLEDDDSIVPELTSESFDTSSEALGISAGRQDSGAAGFITVPDDQMWCPDEYPIKGNANSKIYHKPGESSYDATNPEICFATDEVAVAKGFRPRKR